MSAQLIKIIASGAKVAGRLSRPTGRALQGSARSVRARQYGQAATGIRADLSSIPGRVRALPVEQQRDLAVFGGTVAAGGAAVDVAAK